MEADLPICKTCGVQYAGPRKDCPVCLDERQYVGWDGQQWTSLAELTGKVTVAGCRRKDPASSASAPTRRLPSASARCWSVPPVATCSLTWSPTSMTTSSPRSAGWAELARSRSATRISTGGLTCGQQERRGHGGYGSAN